jgi:MAF protein
LLLAKLGLTFEIVSPQVDERRHPGEDPAALAWRLSNQKASAVADRFEDALVIGSDQVATLDDEILGKPLDHETAVSQLQRASGKEIVFFTGICLLDTASGRRQTDVVPYRVLMRTLTPAVITRYLEKDQPYDCAGSFKSEALGISLFQKMYGDDPNALTGLPLVRLVSMLAAEGIAVP